MDLALVESQLLMDQIMDSALVESQLLMHQIMDLNMSRNSSASMVTRLWAGSTCFHSRQGDRCLFAPEAHTASYLTHTTGSFPVVKRPGA